MIVRAFFLEKIVLSREDSVETIGFWSVEVRVRLWLIESGYHFDVIGEHEFELLTYESFVFPDIFHQDRPVYTWRM